MSVYGYPVLPRAGLGNMLFPWADCHLWCRDNNREMIAPSWRKIRIGPLLRGERDMREYHRLFDRTGQIGGWSKWLRLLMSRKVRFTGTLDVMTCPGETVVVFDDLDCFPRLAGRHRELREGLYRMTRSRYLPDQARRRPYVGIHVRLGDYLPPDAPTRPGSHYRLELPWYGEALREIRRIAGYGVEAVLFSDGTDEELRELLSVENVTRSPHRAAVTDLLALAEAGVIIASRSTFSMWGSFLGQVPAVWHPGSRIRSVVEAGEPGGLEPEWSPGRHLPELFSQTVRERLDT